MTVFFTADLHLRHKNILQYCHREPFFADVHEMNKGLIANWNAVITRSDKVYHLGDFCSTKDSNIYGDYMNLVHGRTIFLRGNHDDGLQHANYYIWRRIEGIKIFMRHWPPWFHPLRFKHSFEIPIDVDLILCGHIHNKWKYRVHRLGARKIPVINVGVDVWNYRPVNLDFIMEEVGRFVSSRRRL